jgi:hypothetical protein
MRRYTPTTSKTRESLYGQLATIDEELKNIHAALDKKIQHFRRHLQSTNNPTPFG